MHRVPVLPFLLLAGCSMPAIADSEVRAVLAEQAACWNRGDLRGFVATYAQDTRFLGSRGLVRGATDLLAKYEKGYPTAEARGRLTFEILEVHPLGPRTMLVVGEYRLARAEPDSGFFTLVLERRPEGVRITHDHTTQAAR